MLARKDAVHVDRDPGPEHDFRERAVPVVVKKEVRGPVVGHEDVGVAVVVIIGRDHFHAGPARAAIPDLLLTSLNVPSPLL